MTPFQVILLAFLLLLIFFTVFATLRGWVTTREGFVGGVVWVLASIAVAWPESTTKVARMLGIDRGANLLLYCSVVGTTLGFVMVYTRLRRLRAEVTLLVRSLAIRDAITKEPPQVGNKSTPTNG